MQHEAQLQNFISAALRQNATILARRHVAELVLSGDMSLFDKAAEAEFRHYSKMQAPHRAGMQVRQLATLFKSDVRSALPFVAVRLHPGPTNDPDTEDLLADPLMREELETAAWLGFASAMFTGQALQSVLSPICHNMVAWGAAPVVASETNWAGRPVSLQRFVAAMDTDSPEFSYVEFTHLDPHVVWEEYDRLVKRITKAEAEGLELREKWQVAALERQLINTLEPEWCCQRFPFLTSTSSPSKTKTSPAATTKPASSVGPRSSAPFHSGVEQFGFRRLYQEHLHTCVHEATRKAQPIPVASVYYVGLDRSVTRYILPHPGPVFVPLTPDQLRLEPELANCPVKLVPPAMAPFGANASIGSTIVSSMAPYPNSPVEDRPALKAHENWPTLLFKETLKANSNHWVSLIRPHTTRMDQDVQESTGVASVLVAAHLDIASARLDFRARSRMAGSMAHDNNQVGKSQFRKVGPLVLSNVTMHQHQPSVDYQAFKTEIELANGDVAAILDTLDPSVSDKLSGRPTTKEVQERGAAVQSRRIGFARERAPAISDWLCRVFSTLLNTDYEEHEVGYKGSVEFWSILTAFLVRYEPLTTTVKKTKTLNKDLIRKLLSPFEVDLSFEDASMDVLQSRLSMAASDKQKTVLAAKMRILMGEDPGAVAKDMARAGMPKESDQVAYAAVESFALKGGERIPVSPYHDHWSHFTTHFAAVNEIITTVHQNPNTDPINAMTSLIQLGTHMSDHRDLAVESVLYASYAEQMDQVLQAIGDAVKQLAPLAKAETQRAAQQGEDPKAAAEQQKLAQRQASWEQRAAQREEAAKVSARMREENHAQSLRQKAEAGALAINVTATKAAIKLQNR